jgi:tetrahydrodipicolinate N-succinyltransferase
MAPTDPTSMVQTRSMTQPRHENGEIGPTACALIVKRVDERTRSKTSINELLRD